MVTIIGGLIGGLIATVVMTAFMMTLGDDSPPPTAAFWAKYVGDGSPDDYMMQGMALHMLYGTGAGAVLAAVALTVTGLPFDPSELVGGLVWGLVYGVILFVGAAVFWMNVVLDVDPEPSQVGTFLFFHLVYGGVLGAVLGLNLF